MSEFYFSSAQRQAELEATRRRSLIKERLLVLLLGPSATGKTTIIDELNMQSTSIAFKYVKPIMTRPIRPNEIDKISVSDQEFEAMDSRGEFVVVNDLYGVRYGTPLQGILDPLRRGCTPVLDYPLSNVQALHRPEYDTLNLYVYPPSLAAWRTRLEASGRDSNGRLEAGLHELGSLAVAKFSHPHIDVSIVNHDGAANHAASDILEVIRQVVL